MPTNPRNVYTLTFLDKSGEKAAMSYQFDPLTVDAQTKLDALNTAVRAISSMVLSTSTKSLLYKDNTLTIGTGQREGKYLIVYGDNITMALYRVTVPGRKDATYQTIAGTDMYNIAVAPFSTLKAAFEAIVTSPEGNPVTVHEIRAVGRNI